jgi:hypothetical protein
VLPVARIAGRLALRLAVAAGASAVVLAYGLFRGGLPEETAETVARVVVAALLFGPAVVLVLFRQACEEVLGLPERLRALPGTAAANAAELARLARERGTARTRRAWRLLVLTRATRELLTPYAPLVALLSVPFLLATAAAGAVTPLLALAALAVLATSV